MKTTIDAEALSDHVKILEITSYPPPHLGWGVRVRLLRSRLIQEGHSCVVLNVGESRKLKSNEYEDVQNSIDLVRKLVKYLGMHYLVHMHANGDSPKGFILTLGVELASLLYGRRCILTFHAGAQQIYFPRARSKLLAPVFWVIFMLAKVIICNSREVKRRIVEYGIDDKKVYPIAAFSRQYLRFDDVALPPDLRSFLNTGRKVFMTSLRFDPRYYVSVLLEALAMVKRQIPAIGLVITAPSGGLEEAKRVISALGIDDDVFLAGDLEHAAFLTLLKRSTLYIRTPTTDGVSSSVMEALSLKIPVIASENGTRPAAVITYPAEDAKALGEKIIYVLEHYDEIKQAINMPEAADTLQEEAQLLVQIFQRRH